MADPIISRAYSAPAFGGVQTGASTSKSSGDGEQFAAQLRKQLDQVAQMQADADRNVEDLLAGRTQNISDVFVAARKAQVAFGLLMEVRNKMLDAYSELKQLRV
ncbi:MAG: flagellar hook-basal body complex protein FliE [Phycisphaerales bacterium]|nr:flagellar hook-basal body complex protein FliE [Phycisphaerales bacterium]